jgi:dTDP-4-amino-4,6-dideoxygalactose transaminase
MRIPFNRPYVVGSELAMIADAHARGQLAGDGYYTRLSSDLLKKSSSAEKVLLTTSGSSALDMSALLANFGPGDEVLMPSYTFTSTANCVVLRGATPVFVDIRPDTLNLDETLIERAITRNTRAIMPMHYAGVGCEMDTIMNIAHEYELLVIEDAAQGINATYKGTPLGTIGNLGCFSFHETKNISCGEGGALLMRDSEFVRRAEILREKGTDRSQFFRGEVDKYSWMDLGSSFLPGEISAAFLWGQLQEMESITARRLKMWQKYFAAFKPLEDSGFLTLPNIPKECGSNGHMFYLLLNNEKARGSFIEYMKGLGIGCVSHYVPLHTSQAGRKFGRQDGELTVTEELSKRIVRLPLWPGLESEQEEVIGAVFGFAGSNNYWNRG